IQQHAIRQGALVAKHVHETRKMPGVAAVLTKVPFKPIDLLDHREGNDDVRFIELGDRESIEENHVGVDDDSALTVSLKPKRQKPTSIPIRTQVEGPVKRKVAPAFRF